MTAWRGTCPWSPRRRTTRPSTPGGRCPVQLPSGRDSADRCGEPARRHVRAFRGHAARGGCAVPVAASGGRRRGRWHPKRRAGRRDHGPVPGGSAGAALAEAGGLRPYWPAGRDCAYPLDGLQGTCPPLPESALTGIDVSPYLAACIPGAAVRVGPAVPAVGKGRVDGAPDPRGRRRGRRGRARGDRCARRCRADPGRQATCATPPTGEVCPRTQPAADVDRQHQPPVEMPAAWRRRHQGYPQQGTPCPPYRAPRTRRLYAAPVRSRPRLGVLAGVRRRSGLSESCQYRQP